MKRKFAQTTLLISVAVLCLSLAPAVYADQSCSTAKAAGAYEFSLDGTLFVPNPVPGAAAGRVSIDTAGNISGTEARNVGGGFAYETLTGSLTVNSDCTGSFTANIYESGILVRTSVVAVVFFDNSNKIRGVQQSLTLPDHTPIPIVISLEANRLFPDNGD